MPKFAAKFVKNSTKFSAVPKTNIKKTSLLSIYSDLRENNNK